LGLTSQASMADMDVLQALAVLVARRDEVVALVNAAVHANTI